MNRTKGKTPSNFRDLTGQRFGRLEIVGRAPNGPGWTVRWSCRCDCGIEKVIAAGGILSGAVISCGCAKKEIAANLSRTHGQSKTKFYSVWLQMIGRCHRADHPSFKDYGARGISVCERWRGSFEAFADDMGPRPDGLSIERKDNDGNYEPSNCKWATAAEQSANRRPYPSGRKSRARKTEAGNDCSPV